LVGTPSPCVTSQVTGQLTDFVLPRAKAFQRAWQEEFAMRRKGGEPLLSAAGVPGFRWARAGGSAPGALSYAEEQSKLEPFGGVSERYGTLVIQIGYIVLFAPAFPVAALVTYANNLVRLRADAFLLLSSTQRPRYQGAEDIGSWETVLSVIGMLGVVTNVGIVGVTSHHLARALPLDVLWLHIQKTDRFLLLVLAEHLLIIIMFLFRSLIPDVPRDLSLAKAISLELRQFEQKKAKQTSSAGGDPTARSLPEAACSARDGAFRQQASRQTPPLGAAARAVAAPPPSSPAGVRPPAVPRPTLPLLAKPPLTSRYLRAAGHST